MFNVTFAEADRGPMSRFISDDVNFKNSTDSAKFTFGSLGGSDTLGALRAANGTNVWTYGLDLTFQGISTYLAANEVITREEMAFFCSAPTTDLVRAWGGYAGGGMFMEELGPDGKPAAQKIAVNNTVGFPLRRYGIGLRWNRVYFENHSPADMVAQLTAVQTADTRNLRLEIMRSLLGDTNTPAPRGTSNYVFHDRLGKMQYLGVKKLLNADGTAIPVGPNGEIFDGSTHTHYMVSSAYWPTSDGVAAAGASVATATTKGNDMNALTRNVREHYAGSEDLFILANVANENDFYAMDGFQKLVPGNTVPSVNIDRAAGILNVNSIGMRYIGNYNGAPVWIKPYLPKDYIFAFYPSGVEPPLVMRIPEAPQNFGTPGSGFNMPGSLRLVQTADHPLYAEAMEREFGMGAWNRWNGAVLFVGNNSTSNSATVYTAPAIPKF